MKPLFILALSALCFPQLACMSHRMVTAESDHVANAAETFEQTLIPHNTVKGKNVEFFWSRPVGEGPFPVIVLVHGHQYPERPGGFQTASRGVLNKWVQRGYVAISVSQPGYGNSDGPPDFCGPMTQQAVQTVISHFREKPFVDPDKVLLYGTSRGATVAAMVAAKDPKLMGSILVVGMYDLERHYNQLPVVHPGAGLRDNIKLEAGLTHEAFEQRSAFRIAEKIKSPVLLIHGEQDQRGGTEIVRQFATKLTESGTPVDLHVLSHRGHIIPIREREPLIQAFLSQHAPLRRL